MCSLFNPIQGLTVERKKSTCGLLWTKNLTGWFSIFTRTMKSGGVAGVRGIGDLGNGMGNFPSLYNVYTVKILFYLVNSEFTLQILKTSLFRFPLEYPSHILPSQISPAHPPRTHTLTPHRYHLPPPNSIFLKPTRAEKVQPSLKHHTTLFSSVV